MSHADEFIRAIWAELRPIYPAIPEIALEDEPSGDPEIAHYRSTDEHGVAHLTFDDDKIPSRAVVAHELWHAAHKNAGGEPRGRQIPDPVLESYWSLMGYTTSYEDAWAEATAKNWWGLWPGEQMADVFAKIAVGACAGCADIAYFGASYQDQAALARVDAFFRGLRGEEAAMTPEEFEQMYLAMNAKHVKPTIDAIKDAFNDHQHSVFGTTSGPVVQLDNE